MKPAALLIAGWSHPAAALDPLARRLSAVCTPRLLAAADFDPAAPLPGPHILLGWSLGGMLALEAAARQPDRVRALVLVATTARFTLASDWLHGLPPAELRALGRALRDDLATGLQGFRALSAAGRDRSAPTPGHALPDPLPALAPLLDGLRYLKETDHRPLLPRIACPALVVHGREDAVIPLAAGQALAAGLPSAQLVVCEGIGHDLPLRAPEAVAEPACAFIHARCAAS